MNNILSFKQSVSKWFGNRMPIADSIKLEQRSTYILPTKAGMLMVGVVLLMMIGATNYQNNLAFMLTFMIASIGLVSILFTFNNLQGLIFKSGASKSVYAGETLAVITHVTSQSGQSHMTIGAGFNNQELFFVDVNSTNGNQISLSIIADQRGWFYLPRIMATSSFPFGLLRVWTWFKFASPILIYPQPIEPPIKGDQEGADDDESQSSISGIDDLYGLKTYQPGDSLSRIDWKALARERGLFTKEFVSYQSEEFIFDWNDFSSVNDELRLSYLCYLVKQASHCNYEYTLKLPSISIDKNSGENHQVKCLRALAMYGLSEPELVSAAKSESRIK